VPVPGGSGTSFGHAQSHARTLASTLIEPLQENAHLELVASATHLQSRLKSSATVADSACMTPYEAVPQRDTTPQQPKSRPDAPIALRLPESDREAVDAFARANDLTRSQVVRKAIRLLLAHENAK
jgi:hypothetical protein